MKKKDGHEDVVKPEPRESLGVSETYRNYFLQYASYVITDRAIPDIADGLKPVQRRILHSLWENEDGRYNKVANITGHTMRYHPHGDASIYSALVGMGQKELLIDTQGNWGDPVTNDPAAAARYIEARLTPFAREVVFAPHLTRYKLSYDGRNKEPLTLPVRFPLLLATGAEGIAVGLATRILPHNFIELLQAQMAYLRAKKEGGNTDLEVFPDFPSGGTADVSNYQDGLPGARVRVRATIEEGPGKTLIIREVPFGATTEGMIDSILAANEKGKIKIAKVVDNTAAQVEVVVTFQRGVDMEKAADALYAFTDCEVTLSSNPVVIRQGKPVITGVSDLLKHNADQTRELLRSDLEVQRDRLERRWHLKSLVQIFVENRIYLRIEKCRTWESVLAEIDQGLEPFKDRLRRPVVQADLEMLTEVKIRRISAWDAEKASEELGAIDEELEQVARHLSDVTSYTIAYLERLLKKYGPGRERRTPLATFETVKAVEVVERVNKLYVDRARGLIGTDVKSEEEVGACSSLDDVLTVRRNGELTVTKVAAKKYVGEDIIHVQVYAPEDRQTVFSMLSWDRKSGAVYAKRFTVGGITRDKIYPLGKGDSCKVLFFSRAPEVFVHLRLKKKPRLKKLDIYIDFQGLLVKGRSAGGIQVTKNAPLRAEEISERIYRNRMGLDPASDDAETPPSPSEAPSSGRLFPT